CRIAAGLHGLRLPSSVFAGGPTDRRLGTLTFGCRAAGGTGASLPVTRLARRTAGHDVVDLVGVDGFVLHQRLGHHVQLVAILGENALCGRVAVIDDAAHLLVDLPGSLGLYIGMVGSGAATEEDLALLFRIHQRPHLPREPPRRHHVSRQLGGTHDVVGSTGSDTIEAQGHFLGDAPAEQRADLADQGALGEAVAVLFRQEHGHAQGTTARNDGYLVDRIVLGHQAADNGVTGLVVGGVELLLLGHDHALALGAHHDLVLGQLELLHFHQALVDARGEQRGLVDQVGQVGTGEAGGATGNHGGVDVVTHRHLAHVHLEDLLAATDIG